MLLIDESMRDERGRLALLDYGLMAELGAKEREGMVRTNTLTNGWVEMRGNKRKEREKERACGSG